jgi:hypothetical protein
MWNTCGKIKAYKFSAGKSEGRRSIRMRRLGCDDNEMGLKGDGILDGGLDLSGSI